GRNDPAAIEALLRGLIASGHAMVRMGNSRPASGSEHHLAHFWESQRLQQERTPLLHGASVGVGAVLIAKAYAQLRDLSQEDVRAALEATPIPTPDDQRAEIEAFYGDVADCVYASHASFLEPDRWQRMRDRLATQWDRVLEVIAQVPQPAWLADRLSRAGAPATPAELGLSPDEIRAGLRAAHYIRDRFTVRQLQIALGLEASNG
ncbi:MAG: iron-containing alcohol dehydrogenase, partial [Anaerolineae bacterium]|nr:iron-containing alcohol dehydrogenase [Anaerolineae bacterium]